MFSDEEGLVDVLSELVMLCGGGGELATSASLITDTYLAYGVKAHRGEGFGPRRNVLSATASGILKPSVFRYRLTA